MIADLHSFTVEQSSDVDGGKLPHDGMEAPPLYWATWRSPPAGTEVAGRIPISYFTIKTGRRRTS